MLQIIVSIFVAFVIVGLTRNVMRRKLAFSAYAAWCALWLSVLAIFWSPELASRMAVALGIGRGADLLVYLSIIVIFYLLYVIFGKLEKIKRDITSLIRDTAIYHAQQDTKRRDSDRKP